MADSTHVSTLNLVYIGGISVISIASRDSTHERFIPNRRFMPKPRSVEWKSAALSRWLPRWPMKSRPVKSQWNGSAMNSYVPILSMICIFIDCGCKGTILFPELQVTDYEFFL